MFVRGTTLHYDAAHVAHGSVQVIHLRKQAVQAHAGVAQAVQAGAPVARGGGALALVRVRVVHSPRRAALALRRRRRHERVIVRPRRQVPDLTDPQVPRLLIALCRTYYLRRERVVAGHGVRFPDDPTGESSRELTGAPP